MKQTFEDIEGILFDGTKEQIQSVFGEANVIISYIYWEETNTFEMTVGNMRVKSHKLFTVPNCVLVFGRAYSNFA